MKIPQWLPLTIFACVIAAAACGSPAIVTFGSGGAGASSSTGSPMSSAGAGGHGGSTTTGTLATSGSSATATSSSTGSTTSSSTGSTTSSSSSSGFSSSSSASSSSGGPVTASAYAHTNTTLFKLDPSGAAFAITQIGNFDCVGGTGQDTAMTDLAVNQAGDLWAVSAHNVYKLQLPAGGTGPVHCATTIPLQNPSGIYFYGLAFAPAGVLDPTNEVLVASNTAGQLWAVDASGNLTQHGAFGTVPVNDGHGHNYLYPNTAWELSGDIVFLANNGSPVGFATVRDCASPPASANCNPTDTLIEIDMTAFATAGTQSVTKSVRGQVVKSATCNDPNHPTYGGMYGIAAYQGNVFGFAHLGYIVTISNTDGTACLALSTPTDLWAGAAITTLAPVIGAPVIGRGL